MLLNTKCLNQHKVKPPLGHPIQVSSCSIGSRCYLSCPCPVGTMWMLVKVLTPSTPCIVIPTKALVDSGKVYLTQQENTRHLGKRKKYAFRKPLWWSSKATNRPIISFSGWQIESISQRTRHPSPKKIKLSTLHQVTTQANIELQLLCHQHFRAHSTYELTGKKLLAISISQSLSDPDNYEFHLNVGSQSLPPSSFGLNLRGKGHDKICLKHCVHTKDKDVKPSPSPLTHNLTRLQLKLSAYEEICSFSNQFCYITSVLFQKRQSKATPCFAPFSNRHSIPCYPCLLHRWGNHLVHTG